MLSKLDEYASIPLHGFQRSIGASLVASLEHGLEVSGIVMLVLESYAVVVDAESQGCYYTTGSLYCCRVVFHFIADCNSPGGCCADDASGGK